MILYKSLQAYVQAYNLLIKIIIFKRQVFYIVSYFHFTSRVEYDTPIGRIPGWLIGKCPNPNAAPAQQVGRKSKTVTRTMRKTNIKLYIIAA